MSSPRANACLIMAMLLALLPIAAGVARAEVAVTEDLVDPTRPLNVITGNQGTAVLNIAPRNAEAHKVSSILIRPGLRVAVVNSRRVRVGDTIGGAEVAGIEPGRVILNIDGQSRELRLSEGSVKTPVIESKEQE